MQPRFVCGIPARPHPNQDDWHLNATCPLPDQRAPDAVEAAGRSAPPHVRYAASVASPSLGLMKVVEGEVQPSGDDSARRKRPEQRAIGLCQQPRLLIPAAHRQLFLRWPGTIGAAGLPQLFELAASPQHELGWVLRVLHSSSAWPSGAQCTSATTTRLAIISGCACPGATYAA
jgi:hypothetical protein